MLAWRDWPDRRDRCDRRGNTVDSAGDIAEASALAPSSLTKEYASLVYCGGGRFPSGGPLVHLSSGWWCAPEHLPKQGDLCISERPHFPKNRSHGYVSGRSVPPARRPLTGSGPLINYRHASRCSHRHTSRTTSPHPWGAVSRKAGGRNAARRRNELVVVIAWQRCRNELPNRRAPRNPPDARTLRTSRRHLPRRPPGTPIHCPPRLRSSARLPDVERPRRPAARAAELPA